MNLLAIQFEWIEAAKIQAYANALLKISFVLKVNFKKYFNVYIYKLTVKVK
jgi:hypothetical protein